jgi:hypothetical protein
MAFGGNASAHPDMGSVCNRPLCAEGSADNVAAREVLLPQDSFGPTEAVAPGRLDQSVSKVGADGEQHATGNRDDSANHFDSSRPAFHAPTPDTASPIATALSAPHVVLDGTAALTGGWLSNGQYALTFVLNARN